MTSQRLLICRRQRHVDEALVGPEALKHAGDVVLVVVPLQAILLTNVELRILERKKDKFCYNI